MKRFSFLTATATAVAAVAISPIALAAPAHATTLDVAGATFNFANLPDQNIGEAASVNDSFTYSGVATVGGVVIDAVVTVIDASSSSMGSPIYDELDQSEIDLLNAIATEAVDVPGCYSNEDFVTAYNNELPYGALDFVSGDLLAGERVEFVDEFYDDPVYEAAINTGVDLCNGPTSGFVQIRVDFLVDGEPVTLNNLSIFAGDIDGLQSVTLFDPKPTTYKVSAESELTVTSTSDEVTFQSPDVSSSEEDPTAMNFVAEAQYDGVSSISYEFALDDAWGGGLSMQFKSFFPSEDSLASTGVDSAPVGIAGLTVLGLGVAIVVARRVRRSRL